MANRNFAKTGRHSKLTGKRTFKLYKALMEGQSQSVACAVANISTSIYFEWRRKGEKHENDCDFEIDECSAICGENLETSDLPAFRRFWINTNRAIELAENRFVKYLNRASAIPQFWQAAERRLMHLNPKRYGKKVEIENTGEVTHTIKKSEHITVTAQLKMGKGLQRMAEFRERMAQKQISASNSDEVQEAEVIEDSTE